MELFNTSTPDKAFKTSVRPLGGLLIFQSVFLLYIFSTWPAKQLAKTPIPFIPDPLKKGFLIASGVLILVMGIGLFIRSKKIWYVFITYLVASPTYLILGMALGYFKEPGPKIFVIPLMVLFSALISGGLYAVTKPAFK